MKTAFELALFYGLVLLAVWGKDGLGAPSIAVLAALLALALCLGSARRHGDSREKLGLSSGRLGPCARLTARWAGFPLLALGFWAFLPPWPTLERLLYGAKGPPAGLAEVSLPLLLLLGALRYPLWAVAQEYALLSFLANRWRDVLGDRPWIVALVNGGAFAAVHAPNPILMTASFAGGTLFTRIFLKTPHLLPLALAHAAAGLFLSAIFRNFYPAMMVGPAYLRHAAGSIVGG